MIKRIFPACCLVLSCLSLYAQHLSRSPGVPSDPLATPGTVHLYRNLERLLGRGIMIGHQDDLAYGVGWKYVPGKSDIRDVTGDYPALYGFELGRLELNHPVNLDSVPFDSIRQYIRSIYARGGVVTLSWHVNNPLTGKTAWDPAPGTVESVLPGGTANALFRTWLHRVAGFIRSLKTPQGDPIPLIFRPFHELNGNWFWWGGTHCAPDTFRDLWHFTITFLRDSENIHQLLYAYNTDRFASRGDYLLKYPGDGWVDILGFDIYQQQQGETGNRKFLHDADTMLSMLTSIASEKHKIPALTEFGYATVPDSTWWTSVLLPALGRHRISYALAWRNAGWKPSGQAEFYVPYPGQLSARDFIRFYHDPVTIFQRQLTKEHVYR